MHCQQPLPITTQSESRQKSLPRLKIHLEKNGLGEEIAWCICPRCRKVTTLALG